MKKFLALMLVALMLLGGAAMAANMTEAHVGSESGFVKSGTSASQSTDVWLQVTASGQIDVTVPLVVVFKTNIDGGSATTSEAYKIVNNSSAAIKVTEVEVTDMQQKFTQNGVEDNMKAVGTLTGGYNEYTLTMLPTDQYATKVWETAKNVFDGADGFTVNGATATLTASADAQAPGLWRIEKKDDSETTDESPIALTLSTSRLTFVTNQKSVDEADIENGVKLFNVAYTVQIDDSTAVGGDIKDDAPNHTYAYTTP